MSYLIVGSLFASIVTISAWFIVFYNNAVNKKAKVDDTLEHINVQLTKTNELIKKYLCIFQNLSEHEQKILSEAALEAQNLVDTQEHNNLIKSPVEIIRLLNIFFSECKQYPVLTANEDLNQLKRQLEEQVKKLQAYSRLFDNAVLEFNKYLRVFPNNAASLILGVKELKYCLNNENDEGDM